MYLLLDHDSGHESSRPLNREDDSNHPSQRECFYLRLVLTKAPGPTTSFGDLRTVDGHDYDIPRGMPASLTS